MYLTRPVFEFAVDWSSRPKKSFSYDLRELRIGYGAEFFNRLQSHVIQGYACDVVLNGADAIIAFDDFTAALKGPLAGFWLPTPFQALEVIGAVGTTQFDIRDQNLRTTLADHPDVYLWVTRPGLAARPCKINAVALQAAGVERVTLTAALGTAVTTADTVCRLHYVRLADDAERGTFLSEGVQRREVKVVELPHEYEAFETGESPIWLYHFFCDAPMDIHWRYTSFAADVVSNDNLFTKFPMKHSGINASSKLDTNTLNLDAKFDVLHPFAMFLPIPLSKPMRVEIFRTTLADPDTTVLEFTGFVKVPNDPGDKVTGHAASYWAMAMSRKFPQLLIQPEDDNDIFDELVGGLQRWMWECPLTVASVDNTATPPTITLDFNHPDFALYPAWSSANWFNGGYITSKVGSAYQVRTILTSSVIADQLVLELNAPINCAANDTALAVPGYDGSFEQRRDKFNDPDNFGGFRAVPMRNLSLQAVDAIVSQGGKK